ncbi:Primosomal protein N', superfamily II helicase, PriA [Wolbachia pipientis]|uniref:replication restart helicase PriA n=1 Tax=Wolbachia TaxID=953 RepID=UPI0005126C9C|nr:MULTISPECIES: primosomal protein N' [Wolbachia]MBA8766155.1 primosomal protein N' [Wolbachia pipientis]QWE34863.1 Primosomal protein N', superfamily II helicase, PriA [Wolbachia endosymbiont of Drosophila simulans]CDR79555.1 primosomal protein N,Primosomal protein N',primosome assembly protein PriA,ATP-dependent protease HslVU (ClpYQ), peptidase subunit,primosomal protein N',DEAD/DEAH box helicase [Wolbachia endosymbiont of Drosophila simulans wAu]
MLNSITMAKTVDVLLPLPIDQLFSYAIEENTEILLGDYVVVPFGKKRLIGIVWKYSDKSNRELKFIEQKIDLPNIRPKLIAFAEWVAQYNLIPVGMLAKVIMGGVLKVNHIDKLVCAKQKQEISEISCQLSPEQQVASDKIISSLNEYSVTLLDGETGSGKTEVYLSVIAQLIKNYTAVPDAAQTLPSQCPETQLYEHCDLGLPRGCYPSSLTLGSSFSYNLITNVYFNLKPIPNLQSKFLDSSVKRWNDTFILKAKPTVTFSIPSLPRTSMTPEYVEMTSGEGNTQILILLPEIVLTSQLVNRVRGQISKNLVEWHSGLTPKTRRNNWLNIASGNAQIIIGARSALFLPYKNLKLIIVDEEYDSSFKQEQGIIYNARDMAIILAKFENIPIILSSATPLLETIHHVKNGNYNHVKLTKRFGGAELPLIKVVDMRNNKQWISSELFESIKQTIEKKQQVMLFLNRRGYAQLAICKKCGYKISCLNCAVWLTYHKKKNALLCHHCSYQLKLPEKCSNCQSEQPLSLYGIGIERLLEEMVKLIPNAKTAMISSDQKSVSNVIDLILKEEVNIIIGTQIIAKGHNFPKLTLVGVMNADLSLENSDLRAAEKTYQLLHQVAGRSGRFNEKGMVIVQTNNPESSIIKALLHQKRDSFYEIELKSRREAKMPPFSRLIALIICGKNQIATQKAANEIVKSLLCHSSSSTICIQEKNVGVDKKEFEILGPSPAAINFLNNKYRYRVLLKIHNKHSLSIQKKLKYWIKNCNLNSSIAVIIDVDPVSFF